MSLITDDQKRMLSAPNVDVFDEYEDRIITQSPTNYVREVKRYWIIGIVLNIFVFALYVASTINVIVTNRDTQLELVRVDGVIVNEAKDVRRDVLLKTTLKRAKLVEESVKILNSKD